MTKSKREIMSIKNKNCDLDQISALMLKEVTACLPTITHIVNMSLTGGDFITDWKTSHSKTPPKKPGCEPLHKNYRPVSNLSFLSKLVEWCMLLQLLDHCTQHNLIPDFLSAYHKNHSTETSLLKLSNDILWGFESQNITSTVILDLPAAFDTIDHDIVLTILHDMTTLESRAQHATGSKIIFDHNSSGEQ